MLYEFKDHGATEIDQPWKCGARSPPTQAPRFVPLRSALERTASHQLFSWLCCLGQDKVPVWVPELRRSCSSSKSCRNAELALDFGRQVSPISSSICLCTLDRCAGIYGFPQTNFSSDSETRTSLGPEPEASVFFSCPIPPSPFAVLWPLGFGSEPFLRGLSAPL